MRLCSRPSRRQPSPGKLFPSWTHPAGVQSQVDLLLIIPMEYEVLHSWSSPVDDGLRLHEGVAIAISSLWGQGWGESASLRLVLATLAVLANAKGRK